ncbi:MAG: NUDIX domain-containing protein [Lewinellaceae bacterium]|nr:NUDIX domain-containing protein [Lewinellaceae bacterium]
MAKPVGTGVVVGRFQVFELNEIQKALIDSIISKHEATLLFLGSNTAPSDFNPLEWPLRSEMFEEAYGDAIEVFEMPDLSDDRIWSQELDRRIIELRPIQPITLYGTTEGLLERYSGNFPVEIMEVDPDDYPETLSVEGIKHMSSFRAGIIYATLRRFPTVYPTVDMAVFSADYSSLMLARKEHENRYRFPGGFTDPGDDSYEMAVLRELAEECGDLEIDELTYVGSCAIDDWRYKGSFDSIITHLYSCILSSGEPVASDDIAEIKWFEVGKLKADLFVPEHRDLFELLESFLQEEH